MTLTREHMLRELELLPAWRLREPVAATAEIEPAGKPVAQDRPPVAGLGWAELKQAVAVCQA
jgi:hypothetical protein